MSKDQPAGLETPAGEEKEKPKWWQSLWAKGLAAISVVWGVLVVLNPNCEAYRKERLANGDAVIRAMSDAETSPDGSRNRQGYKDLRVLWAELPSMAPQIKRAKDAFESLGEKAMTTDVSAAIGKEKAEIMRLHQEAATSQCPLTKLGGWLSF